MCCLMLLCYYYYYTSQSLPNDPTPYTTNNTAVSTRTLRIDWCMSALLPYCLCHALRIRHVIPLLSSYCYAFRPSKALSLPHPETPPTPWLPGSSCAGCSRLHSIRYLRCGTITMMLSHTSIPTPARIPTWGFAEVPLFSLSHSHIAVTMISQRRRLLYSHRLYLSTPLSLIIMFANDPIPSGRNRRDIDPLPYLCLLDCVCAAV